MTSLDSATFDALALVFPGPDAARFIDDAQHPNLHRFARNHKQKSLYPHLWRDAYIWCPDHLEDAARRMYLAGEDHPSQLLKRLDDPWMITGNTAEQLGDEFFLLWAQIRGRDKLKALDLLTSAVPARSKELFAWLGGPFTLPTTSLKRQPEESLTWTRLFGRRLRFDSNPASYMMNWRQEERASAVTNSDLYEFLDSGVTADRSIGALSLQLQLAERRGRDVRECKALSQVSIAYPSLDVEDMTEYPETAEFFDGQDWVGNAAVLTNTKPDLAKFEAALQDTDDFSDAAKRERLASLLEPEEFLCRKLSPQQKQMWRVTLDHAASPHEWMTAVVNTYTRPGEVEMVRRWMGTGKRPSVTIASACWVDFVLCPPDQSESRARRSQWANGRPTAASDELPMKSLCKLIESGASFEEVRDLAERGLSVAQSVEVLVHGTPAEYVIALGT